jgi:NAD+ synthase/NAD+ synthase (glutamine-hydrolysing)
MLELPMRIALAQFNPTVGDFSGNSRRILELAAEAKSRGAQLAIFSELSLCGYPPLDLVERPAFIARNQAELDLLARAITLPSIVGYVGRAQDDTGKPVANCAALIGHGHVQFVQRKMLLPTYDVFDESRYFQPAHSQHVCPFTDEQLGITICEDVWNDKQFWAHPLYERDPVAELVENGANVLINISSSPYQLGKRGLRMAMLCSLAVHHGRPVIYVNQVGGNDSLVFDGSSVAFTAEGEVAARARSFEEDMVLFDTATSAGDVHESLEDELEAAMQALVCGTRDYVRKCGFKKVLVGLSGGIDSAVVAAIAVEAVGAHNVLGVGMPGPYSSEGSLRDAALLAKNLGVNFLNLPVGPVFEAFRAALAPAFLGRPEDVTEENLQARIRGNYLMALSNKFGALLLTTGNKSELAVGYCTLYGDMAGGLAVISDVPKTMVYELAKLINAGREVIPAETLLKPPSAELRPNQTDQDALPPYDVLDVILKAYIQDLESPEEIAANRGFPLELVRDIARKVDRNEYKRQQAAVGLKITSKAFGIGRKVPIAQAFQAGSAHPAPAGSVQPTPAGGAHPASSESVGAGLAPPKPSP